MKSTVNSSKITWTIYQGSKYDDYVQESYCADGDGILSVQKHKLGVYIVLRQEGQFEGAYASLEEALEVAQNCLEEDMPEVFEEALHWEDLA